MEEPARDSAADRRSIATPRCWEMATLQRRPGANAGINLSGNSNLAPIAHSLQWRPARIAGVTDPMRHHDTISSCAALCERSPNVLAATPEGPTNPEPDTNPGIGTGAVASRGGWFPQYVIRHGGATDR